MSSLSHIHPPTGVGPGEQTLRGQVTAEHSYAF